MFTSKILNVFFGKKPVEDHDPLMTDHDLLALAVQKINQIKRENDLLELTIKKIKESNKEIDEINKG